MKPILLALLFGVASHAGLITVNDGTLNDIDWAGSILTNTNNASATFTANQVVFGGNPNFFRQTTHTASPNGAGYNTIRINDVYQPLTITGTGIVSIDFSFDTIYFNPNNSQYPGMGYQAAIFQGGSTFAESSAIFNAITPIWTTNTRNGLTANSFCLTNNSNAQDCTIHPDFSVAGAPIKIGYITGNGLPKADVFGPQYSGLDNFRASITTVTPEPATMGVGFLALGMILAKLRHARTAARSDVD